MKNLFLLLSLSTFSAFAADQITVSDYIDNDLELIEASELDRGALLDTDSINLNDMPPAPEYEAPEIDQASFESAANENAQNNNCGTSKKEDIVCANIMCDFGALMGEWPSECTDYKLKLAVEKAKLPPFKKMPKCFMRDKSCARGGRANKNAINEDTCNSMALASERHACLLGLELNEQEGAEKYLANNDASDSDLSAVPFRQAPASESAEDGEAEFLTTFVDERFSDREDAELTYQVRGAWFFKRDIGTGESEMDTLNYFLEFRDNPEKQAEVGEAKALLIKTGALLEQCSNVPYNEFYNCNYYPDLPRACWTLTSHSDIALCASDHELASH